MLKEEKTAKLDRNRLLLASKGQFATVKPVSKTFKTDAKTKPQKLPPVWECKKGRGVKVTCTYVPDVTRPTDDEIFEAMIKKTDRPQTVDKSHFIIKHQKGPLGFITPADWQRRARGEAPKKGKHQNDPKNSPGLYYDDALAPEKSDRTWWLYKGVFYSTEEKLKPADIAALADEKENRKRLKLEKAHALQAMRQQADGAGDSWKPGREPIPQEVKLVVWQRDGGHCVECGSQKDLEFDHIIPLAMGGANTERNLQLLCADCNRRKGATLG